MPKTKKDPQLDKNTPAEHNLEAAEFMINAQYIKDLSFENPAPVENLIQQENTAATMVNIEVGAHQIADQTFEVELKIKGHTHREEKTVYLLELEYAGIFTFSGIPEEMLRLFLFVECPRQLFPFARAIVARITQESGFPPLILKPIDFGELLRQRLAEAQAPREQEKPAAAKKSKTAAEKETGK